MKRRMSLFLSLLMVMSLLVQPTSAETYYSLKVTLSGKGKNQVNQTVTRKSGEFLTKSDGVLMTLVQTLYNTSQSNETVDQEIERKYQGTALRTLYYELKYAGLHEVNSSFPLPAGNRDWNTLVNFYAAANTQNVRDLLKSKTATLADLAALGGSVTVSYTGGTYNSVYTVTIEVSERNVGGGGGGGGGSSGGGGAIDKLKYPVALKEEGGGTTSSGETKRKGGTTQVDKTSASIGEKVTIITESEDDQMVNRVVVRDIDNKKALIVYEMNGVYSFEMPKGGATVDVTYRVEPAKPSETGVSDKLDTESHSAFMIGDNFGYFQPSKNISRAEVSMIFYRLLLDKTVDVKAGFPDVEIAQWFGEAVETLAAKKILKGVDDGSFQPMRDITRAEFASICVRFAKPVASTLSFSDVPKTHWAKDDIATAAKYGWVTGYDDGTFAPDQPIRRDEAAAIVNRILYRLGDQIAIDAGYGTDFPDVNDSMWGWYDIKEATEYHDFHNEESIAHELWMTENQ